jgi:hypothetical protein
MDEAAARTRPEIYRALMVPLGSTVVTAFFCRITSTGLSASSATSAVM